MDLHALKYKQQTLTPKICLSNEAASSASNEKTQASCLTASHIESFLETFSSVSAVQGSLSDVASVSYVCLKCAIHFE